MVKSVKFKGKNVIIDWDQEDYDYFFLSGLQQLVDDHFKGERRVVVLPITDPLLKSKEWVNKHPTGTAGMKQVEVSDQFADGCVEYGVNCALRQYIDQFDPKPAKPVKNNSVPKKNNKSKIKK